MPRSATTRPRAIMGNSAALRQPPLSWWSVFFPWLPPLRQGRIVAAAACLLLQLTFYGWPAAVMWARLAGPRRAGGGIPFGVGRLSSPRVRADMWGAPPGLRRDI
ncbi:hypothetical protein FFK22_038605 [Mycobacterium sp. KBS0706]|uniref:hypothetical protein n=1 Tax=Mycobacterium sp. KBS0706 TaxID=2578109 RepID=UPI00110FF83D|nr:hypothetical protein [Mycobacterium sp. KBS0706]TSD83279.1 hypothetical protein FFK22_038605 [Mycobacterium sp. KBS0706]